jgi:hypothetical protein
MIHDAILEHVKTNFETELIDNVSDNAKVAQVVLGPVQEDPDYADARLSVSLHENDPDGVYKPGSSNLTNEWTDGVAEIECGGSITMVRRFTAKARILLADTGEGLSEARDIASKLRSRMETSLLNMRFTGVSDAETGEYVSKRVLNPGLFGEMIQAGGPEAYDYHVKVRFQVETTRGLQP